MGLKDRRPTTTEEYNNYKVHFKNWGRWGRDDQLGTLNHITPATVLYARGLIREGSTVSCANPIATKDVVSDHHRNPDQRGKSIF